MSEIDINKLRKELLTGGVAPKYVRRTLEELGQHFSDLENTALKYGVSQNEASKQAKTELGKEDLIISEILAKPELKSWSSRYPISTYLFGSTICYILAMVLILAVAIVPALLMPNMENTPAQTPGWLRMLFFFSFNIFLYVLTPAVTISILVFAKNRLANMLLPIMAISIVAFFGSAWWMVWEYGTAIDPEMSVTMGWGYYFLYFPSTVQPSIDWTIFIAQKVFITLF